MLSVITQILQQMIHALVHEWDTLAKKVGKRTANILLIYVTLGVLLEVFWLTLMLSVFVLVIILD